jgi:hypothetical protein
LIRRGEEETKREESKKEERSEGGEKRNLSPSSNGGRTKTALTDYFTHS